MVCFLSLPVTICVWRRSVLRLLLGPNNPFKSRSDQTGTMWSHKKHWWKLVYGKIVQINVTWQQVSPPRNHGFSIFFLIAPVASFANEIYSGLHFLPARNCSKLGKILMTVVLWAREKGQYFFSLSLKFPLCCCQSNVLSSQLRQPHLLQQPPSRNQLLPPCRLCQKNA